MANDATKVYLLGPADVGIDGTNIGHSKDIALELSFSELVSNVGYYGKSPLDVWHLATMVKVVGVISEMSPAKYAKLMQGVSVLSGGVTGLGIGKIAGARLTPVQLTVTPYQTEVTTLGAATFWRAIPGADGRTISYNEKNQELKFSFTILISESKADGQKYGIFGDPSSNTDVTPPTVSVYLPLDDAAGVSVGATVNATMTEAMDVTYVNADNVQLFATPVGAGAQSKVAGAVSYDPIAFKITFTPTSALSGATAYALVLGSGLRDIAGNRFAGKVSNFTTA